MKKMFSKIRQYIKAVEMYIREDVHNPLSTMSNIGFILIGYLMIGINPVLGTLMIMVGVASTGFHWLRNDCWHKFDIVAIYYLFASIGFWLILGNWGIPLGILVGGIAHYLFDRGYSKYSQEIIGIFGAICLIPFAIQNGWVDTLQMIQWFVYAVIVSQIADRWNPTQDGKWYDVFHAMWHIFTQVGIFYLIN